MKIRLAAASTIESFSDGPGIRYTIWSQGCPHRCKGCHNPQTHAFESGFLEDTKKIAEEINELKYHSGITLSGGEPFHQPESFCEIIHKINNPCLTIWCYTGYEFEQLLESKEKFSLLEKIDVLVDGKFDINKQNSNLWFKGSENQRIIDVQKSLLNKQIIFYK